MKLGSLFGSLLDSNQYNLTPRSRFIFRISILLAGLFFYLAIRKVDWVNFISALHDANYKYLPILFIWGTLTNWLRAARWSILLSAATPVSIRCVFWANMAGYLGNNILPARAGEIIRAAYAGQENKISTPFALATGLVERLIDLIALVILGSVSLASLRGLPESFYTMFRIMSVFAVAGFVGILFVPYLGPRLDHIVLSLCTANASTQNKLMGFVQQILDGVKALHHPKRAGAFITFTCFIWLLDGMGVIILARILYLSVTIIQAFVLLASLGLASAIPSTPGYIGIYQFVAITVLQPFGISNIDALALIILLQGTGIAITGVWGGTAMVRAARASYWQHL